MKSLIIRFRILFRRMMSHVAAGLTVGLGYYALVLVYLLFNQSIPGNGSDPKYFTFVGQDYDFDLVISFSFLIPMLFLAGALLMAWLQPVLWLRSKRRVRVLWIVVCVEMVICYCGVSVNVLVE